DLQVPFYCVDISGSEMIPTDNRFAFHSTTYGEFNLESGQDLCHRYSFSAMQQLLCLIYNSEDHSKLKPLIAALFPYDDDDRKNAVAVYNKIINKPEKAVKYYNQLLYILNNSLFNLRPGNSSWNRSIRECYDPESWYGNGQGFVISSEDDVYLLDNLLAIPVEPSTIYFYTAKTNSGDRLLYSSNNPFPNEGINAYGECNIPIFICLSDGTEKQITFPQ
ncbi:MAG: hypothetical protein HDT25_08815, partial [Ruminococcus sp.]|nr:hypothetical protein [Ruminococcus sp.]